MSAFFKDMSLARGIILGSLVLSLALAVTGFKLHQKRVGLDQALAGAVPDLARETQVLSKRYSKLYREPELEGLKGQGNPETYLRGLIIDPKVRLGDVDISKPTPTRPSKGVIDIKYRVVAQPRDRGFDRRNLANFMWLIEEKSRRVRVTQLSLTREGSLKPWEYGNDRWKWEIEVTSRQKEGE